jgi:hypothetical protein
MPNPCASGEAALCAADFVQWHVMREEKRHAHLCGKTSANPTERFSQSSMGRQDNLQATPRDRCNLLPGAEHRSASRYAAAPSNADDRESNPQVIPLIRVAHDFSRTAVYTPMPPKLQTQLMVNTLGDRYEQGADRVANQVMNKAGQISCSGESASADSPGVWTQDWGLVDFECEMLDRIACIPNWARALFCRGDLAPSFAFLSA